MAVHDAIGADAARPRQVVILAGGRGTRLIPLTDTRPKPMVEFHRKPFLEHLIEMLRDQGFDRVLLLLGYRADVIQDYFGDGRSLGVEINYSVSPVEDETGLRIKRATARLDPVFLLTYCDNYWPMPFDRMWRRFSQSGAPAMVTVYENEVQPGSLGVEINYSVSPVEDETGLRIKRATARLDPVFLLTYCDNYWPMPFDRMWRRFSQSGAPAMVTVYENEDNYSRDNLSVDEEGFVITYDKSRKDPDLKGVDIGFLLMRRQLIDELPSDNFSFEATVYPRLIARQELFAFVTEHRYYSVGDHKRLPVTDTFLSRRPAIILDRDGVLNKRMPQAEYVRSWSNWEWLPGAIAALRRFAQADYRVIVVTNQAGIARGVMTQEDLVRIHECMRSEASEAGGRIDAVYHCPHGWDEGCACRKPKPGMLFQAQRDFHLDLSQVTFIGDDERDGEAAAAADCLFRQVTDGASLESIAADLILNSRQIGQRKELA